MKKTFAVILAVAMLFAACVPAFAAGTKTITEKGGDSASVIKTDISALPSPDGYFTVTFPAETSIPWAMSGDSLTNIPDCSLESHLIDGKTLEVKVLPSATAKMTAQGISTTLAYTLEGEILVNKNTPVVQKTTFTPQVKILASEWNQAIVGTYSDTLTFETTVKAIAP